KQATRKARQDAGPHRSKETSVMKSIATTMRAAVLAMAAVAWLVPFSAARAEGNELRILKGTGGIGFIQLAVMERQKLVEKHAGAAGIKDLKVSYAAIGGPTVANDALLSGAADIVPAGPPGMIAIWDRTRGTSNPVLG